MISLDLGPLILNVVNCSVVEFTYTWRWGHSVWRYSSISAKILGAPLEVVVDIKWVSLILQTIPSSLIIPSSPNIRAYLEVIGFILVNGLVYIRFINSNASLPLTSILPSVLPSNIPAVFLVCFDSLWTASYIVSVLSFLKYQGLFHWPTSSNTAFLCMCQGWIGVFLSGS